MEIRTMTKKQLVDKGVGAKHLLGLSELQLGKGLFREANRIDTPER